MNKPSFKEQYNKIVNAYMKNELVPTSSCACFIGNLLNNTSQWSNTRLVCIDVLTEDKYKSYTCETWYNRGVESIKKESCDLYSKEDIYELETLFLRTIMMDQQYYDERLVIRNSKNEELVFKAMEVTLLKLKEIHEAKGEVVDQYVFSKRELVNN